MARQKSPPRLLSVVRTEYLTPHMLRVTLGGAGMEGFPAGRESANCKLLFPVPGDEKPIVRTYTVRKYRSDSHELDVDFVMHDDHGPGSDWAMHAQAGDDVLLMGPGLAKFINYDADWHILAGDMSAIPAISANLETLAEDSSGYIVLEVMDEEDKQDLNVPESMQLNWVINPEPASENTCLSDAVKALPWLEGSVSIWIAGESNCIRDIRRYIKHDRQVPRENIYASGYWQIGLTEDRHQIVKRQEKDD